MTWKLTEIDAKINKYRLENKQKSTLKWTKVDSDEQKSTRNKQKASKKINENRLENEQMLTRK